MKDDLYGTRPKRGMAGPLIAMLVAFALGIALTAYAVSRWDKIAIWLHPAIVKPVPVPTPVAAARPLASQPAPAGTPGLPDTELTDRVDTIEARIDAIDQRARTASGDADRAEAMLTAFAARRALDRGQPLGYLEGLLRQHFGSTDAPSVALIIASAQRPVTLNQLQDGFDTLRPALATAAPNESWWTGVRREMGNLFVVRHASAPSNVPSDRLARADHALAQGQVDVAATEVARLPGSARASEWLASARRYVLARGALDKVETAALLKAPASPMAAPAGR
ncbi:COG4223 family protein [Sphingomonas sp. MMS24-J13]|uniref:COG4223 family protein n=1 Tax=Sphingomonas sp. MMS24-J13 TaxID=3238686 RepID=UPI003850E85A